MRWKEGEGGGGAYRVKEWRLEVSEEEEECKYRVRFPRTPELGLGRRQSPVSQNRCVPASSLFNVARRWSSLGSAWIGFAKRIRGVLPPPQACVVTSASRKFVPQHVLVVFGRLQGYLRPSPNCLLLPFRLSLVRGKCSKNVG